MDATRDFLGYSGRAPDVRWPKGKVAVSFVVNFEEGAEFSIRDGDARNEAIYEVEHRLEGLPDPCLDSHFEYGARAGWWRVMELFDASGVKVTVSACGRAVDRFGESEAIGVVGDADLAAQPPLQVAGEWASVERRAV